MKNSFRFYRCKVVLAILCLLPVIFLSSCLKDEDSDSANEYYAMATVYKGGDSVMFQMDDSAFLVPYNDLPADTFQVGERYFVYFSIGDTSDFPVYSKYPILLQSYAKAFIRPVKLEPDESISKQVLSVQYVWCSSTYYNIVFTTYKGTSSPETFELVRISDEETNSPTDTQPELVFELQHNVETVSVNTQAIHFYSFDVSSLESSFPNATKLIFRVKIPTPDGYYSMYTSYIPKRKSSAILSVKGRTSPILH
jgi:hypothetical protein